MSNGSVTIVDVAAFRREKDDYSYPLAAYEAPWERSIEIDTEMDFPVAELLTERINGLLN